MSTKTTFKRIALVTVAVLGFGVLSSVAPASAAVTPTNSLTITSTVAAATAATPATGAADIVADLKVAIATTAMVPGDTMTVTYTVKNPAGTDISDLVTIVETTTAVAVITGTLTLGASGKSITIADTATVATHTIGKLTIPASALVTGGTYTVTTVTTMDSTHGGTPVEMNQSIYVAGVQVTQGTTKTVAAGAAVTGNNARVKVFFPTTAVGDVYKIVPSGVGSIVNRYAIGGTSAATATIATDYSQGLTFTAGGTDAASVELTLSSATAGDQFLTVYSVSDATGVATAKFKATVTWGAAPAYVAATAFIGATAAAVTADITAASQTSSGIYDATAKARIDVKQYTDAAKTIQTSGTAKAVLVSISGAGAVDTTSGGATRGAQALVASSATASTDSTFYVFADGRTGKGTITVAVDGVTVKTYTWLFTGTSASLAEDADNSPGKTYIGIGETGTLSVLGYDANSILSDATPDVYATSDTKTVATVSTFSASGTVVVTGVTAGTSKINLCIGDCSTSTKKIAIAVEVTKTAAKTGGVTLSFDKTSYEPGEKMVLTVKAVDTNGRPVADGDRALLSSTGLVSNVSFGGASAALPTSATVALAAGIKTYTLYAPSTAGTVTVSGKEGTSVGLTERAAWAAANTAAYTAPAITTSVTVINSGVNAAAAAAEEATAAANDATDAALSAAEAATAMAQEAVDAVAELSASVTKLISALRAQITTLTNLVVKIQKKVRA
jgi:hypothetical protein